MNEDGNMNITADTANKASELRPDIDLNAPKLGLKLAAARLSMELMEGYIGKYSQMEHDGDLDGMTDTLIRITERVAEVRRLYQPDFPLPTFAEIRRVVQDEWDEDMGKIDPREDNPTAGEIEEETESADDAAGEGDQA